MARTPCPHNRGSAETQEALCLHWGDEAALPQQLVLLLEQQSASGPALPERRVRVPLLELERRVRVPLLELERRVRAQVLELERGPATEQQAQAPEDRGPATEQENPTLLFLHDECRHWSRTPARRSPAAQFQRGYS